MTMPNKYPYDTEVADQRDEISVLVDYIWHRKCHDCSRANIKLFASDGKYRNRKNIKSCVRPGILHGNRRKDPKPYKLKYIFCFKFWRIEIVNALDDQIDEHFAFVANGKYMHADRVTNTMHEHERYKDGREKYILLDCSVVVVCDARRVCSATSKCKNLNLVRALSWLLFQQQCRLWDSPPPKHPIQLSQYTPFFFRFPQNTNTRSTLFFSFRSYLAAV